MTLLERLPVSGWALEVRPVLRGGIAATAGHRHRPRHRRGADPRAHRRVDRRGPPSRPGSPTDRSPPSPRWPMSRRIFTAARSIRSISTRSGVTTPSSTWWAPPRRSRSSASTRSAPARWPRGSEWSGPAHGLLPNPAPAVVALLEGVPTWGRNISVELTTPTGAAIVAALSLGLGPMPSMRVHRPGIRCRCRGSSTSCPTAPRWSPGYGSTGGRVGTGAGPPSQPERRRRRPGRRCGPARRAARGQRR